MDLHLAMTLPENLLNGQQMQPIRSVVLFLILYATESSSVCV